jgi:hypothetical protein
MLFGLFQATPTWRANQMITFIYMIPNIETGQKSILLANLWSSLLTVGLRINTNKLRE